MTSIVGLEWVFPGAFAGIILLLGLYYKRTDKVSIKNAFKKVCKSFW